MCGGERIMASGPIHSFIHSWIHVDLLAANNLYMCVYLRINADVLSSVSCVVGAVCGSPPSVDHQADADFDHRADAGW